MSVIHDSLVNFYAVEVLSGLVNKIGSPPPEISRLSPEQICLLQFNAITAQCEDVIPDDLKEYAAPYSQQHLPAAVDAGCRTGVVFANAVANAIIMSDQPKATIPTILRNMRTGGALLILTHAPNGTYQAPSTHARGVRWGMGTTSPTVLAELFNGGAVFDVSSEAVTITDSALKILEDKRKDAPLEMCPARKSNYPIDSDILYDEIKGLPDKHLLKGQTSAILSALYSTADLYSRILEKNVSIVQCSQD